MIDRKMKQVECSIDWSGIKKINKMQLIAEIVLRLTDRWRYRYSNHLIVFRSSKRSVVGFITIEWPFQGHCLL